MPLAEGLGGRMRIATAGEHQDSIEHDIPDDECENKPERGCKSRGASKVAKRAVSAQPSQLEQRPWL